MIKLDHAILEKLPCTQLKGVGPKVADHLKRLNIHYIQDLLFHLPFRYEDRTVIKPLYALHLGDHAQVQGEVVHAEIKKGRRQSLLLRLEDSTGFIILRFFHFNSTQYSMLAKIGQALRCYGEVRRGLLGFEMIHPEYAAVREGDVITGDTLTAVYPTTEGLHQYSFRKLTDQALQLLEEGAELQEFLPHKIRSEFSLFDLKDAIRYVHRPPRDANQQLLLQGQHPSQQRLVFEELLAHQLSLVKIKSKAKSLQAVEMNFENRLSQQFITHLPFQLTSAQQKVIAEITTDLKKPSPMLRLVQGDVGSGKTVVAAISSLHVIESGYQVAMMAPTELLAEQHFNNFSRWFEPLSLKVTWLTSSIRGKQREDILQSIATREIDVVIGTHALFQKDIEFAKLGLIIIDEQHRFGVHQRLALLNKGVLASSHPHQLIMSATPIPRTLAMTAYADLDCSTIDELPPGRTPIRTIVLPNSRRQELITRVKKNCLQGAQVYWVCTLIEESDILQCQAAEDLSKELTLSLPELKIGLIHGRLKSLEKEQIMAAFKDRQIDLLVATTVIEVGVDVPNANLMVIENAERLGLAQLHQLRGRVGRGALVSHCVLLYQHPLSKMAKERLAVLRDSCDGFLIAQKDLELRGPGEMLGTRQTGLVQFRMADLARDQHLLPAVQQAAAMILKEFPEIVDCIIRRWLADKEQFSEV